MFLIRLMLGLLILAATTWSKPPPVITIFPKAFTYNRTTFLLRAEPFVIIGGQLDPQRIPYEYWRRSLFAAKAMGINTIFSYIFWNELEPEKGKWKGKEAANNITGFVQIAQEEGLYVVLRPGPYVCGEREWGGMPYWLSRIPDLKVRSYNAPFLHAVRNHLKRLAKSLAHLQITRGGNIIMVQVENKYGSYGDDMTYKLAMRNITASLFDVPLFTVDDGSEIQLRDGHIPGVLSTVAGGPEGLPIRDKVITDSSSLGPQVNSEAYIMRPDHWGPASPHNTVMNRIDLQQAYLDTINASLTANISFNIYPFHGGTNFGFTTGSVYTSNRTIPWTNSYDHGYPLDEAGRTTPFYYYLLSIIFAHYPPIDGDPIHAVPLDEPLRSLKPLILQPYASIFETVSHKKNSAEPKYMDALHQNYGFILYEHKVLSPAQGLLKAGDRPRDKVTIYVNGHRKAFLDNFYSSLPNVTLSLQIGDKLQLFVENAGRTSYWDKTSNEPNMLLDPYKGINGPVFVGDERLRGWKIIQFPCDEPPLLKKPIKGYVQRGMMPIYYAAKFALPRADMELSLPEMDTYVTIEGGTRGVVWVNGFNLGRYWNVGPQQSLYLPGAILKPGMKNKITILEMKPWNLTMVARCNETRSWGNQPDPDAPNSSHGNNKQTMFP